MSHTSSILAIAVAAALTVGSAAGAAAQDAASLLRADRSGDGAISREEAQTALKARFAALDKNRDRVLSEAEFADGTLARITRHDADGDGRLTRDELRNGLRSMRQR